MEATYKRNPLCGFMAPEEESITAQEMWQLMAGTGTEESHLQPQTQSRESELKVGKGYDLSKPTSVFYFLQGGYTSPQPPPSTTKCSNAWGWLHFHSNHQITPWHP